jgi:hypothetical protein
MTDTFALAGSQRDRIRWDEMTAREAHALFAMDEMADDRSRAGAEVAALYWSNTEILLEHGPLVVDDEAEARARYLEVFARTWDALRKEKRP